jgi:hypothetical protein
LKLLKWRFIRSDSDNGTGKIINQNLYKMEKMTTAKAMKLQGFRYFSSLTPQQKDRTIYLIVKAKLGLLGLSPGLAKPIMAGMLDELIKTREAVEQKLKNQKCFKHEGNYYPLNVKEIIKN